MYGCDDCSGCERKARCLYKYDAEKDGDKKKVMKINEKNGKRNPMRTYGISNRQIQSFQTEGYFGNIKENENFITVLSRNRKEHSHKKIKYSKLLIFVGMFLFFVNGTINCY